MSDVLRIIQMRQRVVVNTDPQRRCYYGVHARSELGWSAWEDFLIVPEDRIEDRVRWWEDLNSIAVQDRGEEARREFRVVPA